MAIYNLSAEERKQRASQIRDLKESRYLYKQYLKQKEQAEREQREQEIAAYHAQKEKDSQNFLVKTFHTIGDVASNVITGAVKGLEGIYDLGAGVVGAVGGIFDSDFRDSVQQHIAYDWTSENIGNPLQELTKHSYLNDWGKFGETIENVASGVGQMLPAVAMNFVVPGSGIFVTGASAAGKGTESAFQEEGTNYYRGLLYGAASGGVEMLTEKISGVVGSNATGKGFLDKALSKLTKTKLGKVLVGSAGEAGEEALSELVNPLIQNIYKDKGFFEDFMTTEHLKDIGESALVGGLTSMVYGETVGRLTRRAANIQESLSELSTLEKKENNLWSNGKLAEQQEKINQQKQEIYESISKELQSVKTDEGRAKYIDMLNKYGVNKFNADGTIIVENGSNLSLDANGEQITDGATNQAQNGLATAQNYNQDAYSPTLRGKEQSLEFAPTSEELTETQRLAKQEFTRLNKGKVKANLVFSNSMGKDSDGNDIQGAYRNGVLYISTNANAVQEVIKHEMTHYAEGTKAYVRYARYILKEIQNNKTLSERFGNLVEKIKQTKDLYQKVEQNKSLSQQEYDIITEVVAQYTSENLFTSEEQIARLARSNRTFFEKFKNWIADKIAYFKKRKNLSKDERQVLDFLTKAEKLYSKALSESWGAMDYAESIDNSDENRYSIKDKLINKTFPPYNESYSEANQIATRWAKQDNVKDGWQKLVSYKNKWYKIEKFSDMDFGYLIVDRIPNSKYNAELEELRKYEQNNYADSLDQGLSEYENVRRNKSVDSTISNDRHSDRNIPTMAKSGDSGRENTINGRRDSGQSNRNKQGNIRYSLSVNDSIKEQVKSLPQNTYRVWIPAWRGELTKEKIAKYLKEEMPRNNTDVGFYKAIKEFSSVEELYKNIFYHGTGGYINKSIRPSIALKRGSFEAGGGYDEDYYAISVSRSKNIASNFTGMSRYGSVYTIVLRKNARVISLPQIQDSVELEDYIVELWEQGVDAVRLGDWNDWASEQELAILNPHAIVVGGHETYPVFNKKKFENLTLDEVVEKYRKSIEAGDNKDFHNSNIRFSISKKNSEGEELTDNQREFFKDSKATDDDGNLMVVYHGTMTGDFSVFDSSKANVESDMGAGFYFTSSREDVGSNYENGGQDFEGKIDRLAERIQSDEDLDYDEAKEKARKQLTKQTKLFEVYLNMTNPAYVGGNYDSPTMLFADYESALTMEDFDNEDDYYDALYEEKDEFVAEVIDKVDNILSSKGITDYEDWHNIVAAVGGFDGISIADLQSELNNNLYAYDEEGNLATNEVTRAIIEALGYDGIIDNSVVDKWGYNSRRTNYMEGIDEETRHYIVFEPNQIKYITNQNPTKSEDIRYSLSKGQVKKIVANKTRHKSYSRKDAEIVVNNILDNYMDFGGKYGDIAGKTKQQVIDQLWLYMNTSTPGYSKAAFDIADYIIENGFVEDIVGSEINEEHVYIVETLREYMHKIDLDSIKGEIKYRYDKDNSPYLIWGKRKGERGMGADQIAQELQERGIRIEAINEADCFFEIADTYKNSLNQIKKSAKQSMKELGSDTIKQLRQDIVREILVGIDTQGQETEFNKTIQKYVDKVSLLKAQLKDTKERNKAINNLFSSLDRVKAFEKYQSAEIQLADEVVGLVKLLKNVKTYRDNLSSNIRDIMSKYSKEVNGTKLYNLIANNGDGIDNPVGAMIEDIARNRGELTTAEIKNLDMIIRNFIHNVKEYDRVFFEGKTQSDTEIVTQAIKETREAVKVKDSGLGGSFSQLTRWLQSPVWRFERLGSYRKNSIMARVFKEFQQGVDKQADFNMRVAEHYKEFFKTNKKIVNEWSNQKIEIAGTQMSKGQMISLYMLSHRKQAQSHLFDEFGNGTIRLTDEKSASAGKVKDAINKGQDVQINRAVISEIESHLTDVDKDFIKLTKEFFNKIARDAKYDTDMAMFGVSNVDDSNDYIPIRVADDQLYKELGNDKFNFTNLFSVYSASFNQDTKPNANNKIVVENIIDIVNRHSKQMSAYYGLAQPVKTFNRLFNKKLEDGSKLRVEINKVDSSFETYVGKLLSDMQGNVKSKEGFDRLVSKVRGWGARAALGFNPKVLASQFVSLPAAAAIGVKYRNLAKGLAMAVSKKTDFEKLTKYAPMLYDRFRDGNNIDVGLLKQGQGVAKSIDKFTDIVTAPIGMIDKFVCGAVWNACLEQTKDNKSYANYSEEHYKAAAQLTEEAVIKTQANYTALYRPEILRSQSSFLQLTTMFMSEPLQQFSLLASAVDKIRIAKTMLKNAKTDAEKAEAESLFKQAKSESAHAISAVVVDTIILALIAQAFKWIKGKEDEDKVQGFLMDFAENYIGMFPIVKDLYSYFSGYDITNMAYTGLTNIATALEELYNIVDLLASGESYSDAEINGKIRKVVLGISQLFGVPVRNAETYIKGIIQKFSPDAIYRYDNFFYNKSASNYNADLKAAIEKGDESLADTILDLMLEEEKVSVKDKEIRKNLISLYNAGYSVLPKSVGDYITYDGEKIYFTQKQKNRFKSIYEQSNDKAKVLITSNEYKEVESKIQAQSIKFIYDYYYNLALEDLLGVDLELKNLLFGYAFDIEDLALYVSYARSLESDKDENGKTINGTLKAKIQAYVNSLKLTIAQKYMLMGYLGYTNKVGKAQVKAYIQRLKLTKEQKAKLFEMSGYSDEK